MTTITADHIRVLARVEDPDAVLALVDGEPTVVPAGQVDTGDVICTRPGLVAEFGEEITDTQAEVLAAGLTAQFSPA